MNFSKYKRFFSFGCSFTTYHWMTWADIIAEEISESYKYAQVGAGNFFIFQALNEAHIKHRITKDDLVMIMFSNVTREDKFTRSRGWITPGNLYYQNEYDKNFLDKFLCHHGYLMRDLNIVHSLKLMLDHIGCDYELMSIVPFDSKKSDDLLMSDVRYLKNFYQEVLSEIKSSPFETVFNSDWNSRKNRPSYTVSWQTDKYIDNHPTPLEHLEYLEKTFPSMSFKNETIEKVHEENRKCLNKNFDPDNFISYKKSCYYRLGTDARYE